MSLIHFTKDLNRCFTTISEEELELDVALEELSGQESGMFSILMEELNTEADHSTVFEVANLQENLPNNLKPLMENVLIEAYNLLHLSELLRSTALQAVGKVENGDQDEVQNFLISSHHTLQISEMDTTRMQLADFKRQPVRAEEEKLKVCNQLQNKLCASENMVQFLRQELRSSQHSIQSLRDSLQQSADSVQFLKVELKGKEERIHLLKERLAGAQESTKFIQEELDVYKDRSHVLHQQLSATKQQNHALREVLMACEARVQEAKREKQLEVEGKEKCKNEIRNVSSLLDKGLNSCLKDTIADLQEELKMSLKREERLKRTIKKAKAKNKAEVEQLQYTLDKARKEAREMEMKLCTDIIGLKERLVDEHAILARELKKTVKNKMELEEIIRNLSYEVSCLARHW